MTMTGIHPNPKFLPPQPSRASMPTKWMLLSIAFAVSAPMPRAVAFVPPSGLGPKIARCYNTNQYFVPSRTNNADAGVCTQLWAESSDDSNEAPKATQKGAQNETAAPNAKSSSSSGTSKAKSKSTSRKTSKGTAQTAPKSKTRQTNKRPLEISTKSLSPSQTQSSKPAKAKQDGEDDVNQTFNIPTTGYSLADSIEEKGPDQKGGERFETTLTPLLAGIQREEETEVEILYDEDGFPTGYKELVGDEKSSEGDDAVNHQGVARIDTISTLGNAGEEPVRWLVSMGETTSDDDVDGGVEERASYALIDLPPYSDKLADEIRSFMDPAYDPTAPASEGNGESKANLDVILITNQQCIHYDTSPAVYVTRKSDMAKWKKAFPTAEVVMYRLDVPRECREEVTQVLDGYGPWGWDENGDGCGKFVETGRPLTIEEWDDDTKNDVLSKGELPPDDRVTEGDEDGGTDEDERYSAAAVRQREQKHRLLAVYTPGHTFGSVTYVFPKRGLCCSGYTLPLESAGGEAEDVGEEGGSGGYAANNSGSSAAPGGPRLDYQGYLATSASRPRQMSSALSLINNYIDRFRVVLPARGDMVSLSSEEGIRKKELMESVGLYQKIGEIYGRLGIVE